MNRTTSKIAIQNPPNQPKIYKIIKQINDNIQTKTIPTYTFQKLVAADWLLEPSSTAIRVTSAEWHKLGHRGYRGLDCAIRGISNLVIRPCCRLASQNHSSLKLSRSLSGINKTTTMTLKIKLFTDDQDQRRPQNIASIWQTTSNPSGIDPSVFIQVTLFPINRHPHRNTPIKYQTNCNRELGLNQRGIPCHEAVLPLEPDGFPGEVSGVVVIFSLGTPSQDQQHRSRASWPRR
jgi:hypothetical protein